MDQGFDPQIAAQELQRRRALLQQLQQQSMQQPIQGPQGLAQLATKLATAYILGQKGKGLGEQEKQYADQYQSGLSEQMGQYMDRMQGQSAVKQFGATPEAESTQVTGAVAPDPRAAVTQAMLSRFPEMQKMGAAGMAQLGKSEDETFGTEPRMLKGADGNLIAALIGNKGTIRPMQGYQPAVKQEATPDGQLYNPYSGTPGSFVGQTMTPPKEVLPGHVGQVANRTGEVKWAPKEQKVQVTPTTIVAGSKAGMEAWAKKAADTVDELSMQARGSVKMLGQLNQLEKLTQSGTLQGPAAAPGMWLGQLAQAAGFRQKPEDLAKLQNSETFGNTATNMWLEMMNAAGGSRGLVKEESQRIADNLVSLTQTPQGRLQIIAHMRKVADQNIRDAQQAQKEFGAALQSEDTSKFTFGLGAAQLPNTAPLPASDAANGAKPIVKNW